MTLGLIGDIEQPDAWIAGVRSHLPDLEIRKWPDMGDVQDIQAALVWSPPPGCLKMFPNLQLVISTGAGVDHILRDRDLPDVPIVRIVDPSMTLQMSEYVILEVLRFQRRSREYQALQAMHQWQYLPTPDAASCTVGIMGLGVMGLDVARKLRTLGFPVRGWSRTAKSLDDVDCFSGREQLPEFLSRCQILSCLLPLTPETAGILNRDTFSALPAGAYLINSGRGQHLVEADLLAALASRQLSGATLDVFQTEPLPADHPFWTHPQITVTPHIAARTLPHNAANQVADAIQRRQAGLPLENLVQRERGY